MTGQASEPTEVLCLHHLVAVSPELSEEGSYSALLFFDTASVTQPEDGHAVEGGNRHNPADGRSGDPAPLRAADDNAARRQCCNALCNAMVRLLTDGVANAEEYSRNNVVGLRAEVPTLGDKDAENRQWSPSHDLASMEEARQLLEEEDDENQDMCRSHYENAREKLVGLHGELLDDEQAVKVPSYPGSGVGECRNFQGKKDADLLGDANVGRRSRDRDVGGGTTAVGENDGDHAYDVLDDKSNRYEAKRGVPRFGDRDSTSALGDRRNSSEADTLSERPSDKSGGGAVGRVAAEAIEIPAISTQFIESVEYSSGDESTEPRDDLLRSPERTGAEPAEGTEETGDANSHMDRGEGFRRREYREWPVGVDDLVVPEGATTDVQLDHGSGEDDQYEDDFFSDDSPLSTAENSDHYNNTNTSNAGQHTTVGGPVTAAKDKPESVTELNSVPDRPTETVKECENTTLLEDDRSVLPGVARWEGGGGSDADAGGGHSSSSGVVEGRGDTDATGGESATSGDEEGYCWSDGVCSSTGGGLNGIFDGVVEDDESWATSGGEWGTTIISNPPSYLSTPGSPMTAIEAIGQDKHCGLSSRPQSAHCHSASGVNAEGGGGEGMSATNTAIRVDMSGTSSSGKVVRAAR